MKRGRKPKVKDDLLCLWWNAGVCVRDIADQFGCHTLTVSQAARRNKLPQRSPGQKVINLAKHREDRRAMILALTLQKAARETRAAMALSEMVDGIGHQTGGARKKPAG